MVSIGFEPEGSHIQCAHIPIHDDHAVEDAEYFTVRLLTYYENVELPLKKATITILPDNDRKFYKEEIIVNERPMHVFIH